MAKSDNQAMGLFYKIDSELNVTPQSYISVSKIKNGIRIAKSGREIPVQKIDLAGSLFDVFEKYQNMISNWIH